VLYGGCNMLIPQVCPVCNQAHNFNYQVFVRCMKRFPVGEVCYPEYRVRWGPDVTKKFGKPLLVEPCQRALFSSFGIVKSVPKAFNYTDGLGWLLGRNELKDGHFVSVGKHISSVDFSVDEWYEVFELPGFDKWLKVGQEVKWIDRYEVDLQPEGYNLCLCFCPGCRPVPMVYKGFIGGRNVNYYVFFSQRRNWVLIDFGIGRYEARVMESTRHMEWLESFLETWRFWRKIPCGSYDVYPLWDKGKCYKVRVDHKELGVFEVDCDGCVRRW